MADNIPTEADHVIALIDGALDDVVVGPDAIRWTSPAAPDDVPADVRVGDVVDYHGSITSEHGECVIVAVDGVTGRLSLRNHYYPEIAMDRVRRTSITQTGQWVPVCRCEHPHTHPINGATGCCPCRGCSCPHHP